MNTKKYIVILLIGLFCLPQVFSTGQQDKTQNTENNEKISVFVSIPPQSYFVEKIGGDRLNINVMVPAGKSPATYEPAPAQITALSTSEAFFSIGVPFEKVFIPKIKQSIPNINIIDTSQGIKRKSMQENGAANTESPDPHIWMSPKLVKKQAQNIYNALVLLDPSGKEDYTKGLKKLLAELNAVDKEIQEALKPYKGQPFFIFHPSMGYFADSYNLKQIAVEVGGKEPSVAEISKFIEKAKTEGIKIIFIQPEFSKEAANTIAKAINASLVQLSPLNPNYIENLKNIAKEIRQSYNGK